MKLIFKKTDFRLETPLNLPPLSAPRHDDLSPNTWRSILNQPQIPTLVLPDGDYFEVNVLDIISGSEICVRLFGQDYDESLEELKDQVLILHF